MAPGRLLEGSVDENGISTEEKRNGEIVIGDVEHDGRVVLYIIKGTHALQDDPTTRMTAAEVSLLRIEIV